jgi:hypothetical protein
MKSDIEVGPLSASQADFNCITKIESKILNIKSLSRFIGREFKGNSEKTGAFGCRNSDCGNLWLPVR